MDCEVTSFPISQGGNGCSIKTPSLSQKIQADWLGFFHLSFRATSLPLAAQMNEVEALPQMKWACAQ